jgi:TonB family protein
LVLAVLVATLAVVGPHPPRPEAGRPRDTRGFVTADGAVLKKAPSADAETVGRLNGGDKVTLVADLGRWYQVRSEKGESGFVSAESVEKESEREVREKRAKTIAGFAPVFGLVAEDTDVLLAPFPQAPKNGRLSRGTVIAIHSVDHSFYAFKTKAGDIAFVNSADVDLVPSDPSKPEIKPAPGKAVKDLTVADSAPPPPEVEPEPASSPARVAEDKRPAEATPAPAPSGDPSETAVLVTRVEPAYPERARRAAIEGMVELEVTIAPDGSVSNVEVVRGLPFGISEAAADAVGRWKYRPARGKDGPVVSRKTVRILFTLGR